MEYLVSNNGIDVTIRIGDSNHGFSAVINGVTYEYEIEEFVSNYKNKYVSVAYLETLRDNAGLVIRERKCRYTEDNLQRYMGLYGMSAFTEAAGDFYGKQCVNGVMERTVKFKAFDNSGALIDYTNL